MTIGFNELSPSELAEKRDSGELWQLLDVREPWELEVASVDDVISIPMGEIPARFQELDESRPVVVMCHGGVRSARVATWLAQQGIKDIYNLTGGINAWSLEVDPSIPRY